VYLGFLGALGLLLDGVKLGLHPSAGRRGQHLHLDGLDFLPALHQLGLQTRILILSLYRLNSL